MKTKRPTSVDVAKLAGVSRSTVSFVLNGVEKANIGEATKARVFAAAKALNYVPFAAGRSLASGRTHTLGLVVCHAEHLQVDAFIPQLLYSVTQVAQGHRFKVIVEAVENPAKADGYLELVRAKRVDGLIVLNPRHDDTELAGLACEGFPLVIMGASSVDGAYAVSSSHNTRPAMRATKHLIGLGHKRIAHISYGSFAYQGATERLQGYREALEEAGLPFNRALVREGDYSAASGFAALTSLLEVGERFTALFASNDTVALGAMAALREKGLRIPEDVAVVGYDDIPLAPYAAPPLTTIRSPILEHGRLAAETLIGLVRGGKPEKPNVDLELELIVRVSCGANRG